MPAPNTRNVPAPGARASGVFYVAPQCMMSADDGHAIAWPLPFFVSTQSTYIFQWRARNCVTVRQPTTIRVLTYNAAVYGICGMLTCRWRLHSVVGHACK